LSYTPTKGTTKLEERRKSVKFWLGKFLVV